MNNKPNILLLGDINSIHLHKWIVALKDQFNVLVFSIDELQEQYQWLKQMEGVVIFDSDQNSSNSKGTFSYLKHVKRLKKLYKKHRPEITHAHYATSYGLLGALCRPKNYCISAWGTDVYLFPKTSFLHAFIFKRIIKKADYLFATSNNLAAELQLYTKKKIQIIPFGIDTQLFSPSESQKDERIFTVGTVKGLDTIYGIDRLIDAFAAFNQKHPDSQCFIYGQGPHKEQFVQQVSSLGMNERILFKGFVVNTEVPAILNSFDVYCALSRSESFGVAVIEASSCELPVIVSNIGGLTEVVRDNETGYIVNAEDKQAVVDRLEKLYNSKELRKQLGTNGRFFVSERYEWSVNAEQQINKYFQILVNKIN